LHLKQFFKEFSRLLVATGAVNNSNSYLTNVQVIDLASEFTTCVSLPDFPRQLCHAFDGLGYQNEPIIYGGQEQSGQVRSDCNSICDSN